MAEAKSKEFILTIDLGNGIDCTLTSNNPDLDKLVKIVVDNKDIINLDQLKVRTDNEDFDTPSFEDVLKTSLKEFLNKISINFQDLEKVMSTLENDRLED